MRPSSGQSVRLVRCGGRAYIGAGYAGIDSPQTGLPMGERVTSHPHVVGSHDAMSTKQLVFMLAGAVIGLCAGVVALALIWTRWHQAIEINGPLVLLMVAGLIVGGLVAGAYGAQAIIYRTERSKKKHRRSGHSKSGEASRRKDKKRR